MSHALAYRTVAPLHWRSLAGEWVVLLEADALVCQLDTFNATVLTLIEEGVFATRDIAERMAQAAGVEFDEALALKVSGICDALSSSGVIETADS